MTTTAPSRLSDPLALAQDLISRPSVTPADAGALDVLQTALETLGFTVMRHKIEEVDNLYARLGSEAPNLCFAGHTDVVPPGDEAAWTSPPFEPILRNDRLWGRGACDMKTAIAAFVAACARRVEGAGRPSGSLSLLITGDEEGPGVHGTKAVLPVIHDAGERIDHCVVGEPTSVSRLADTVKIGRRGSLNAVITVTGRQGHVAYPERAQNPLPVLLSLLERLRTHTLDAGPTPHFQPSNLEITSIDVGNPTHNVIPAKATARLNIRFNVSHCGADLERWIQQEAHAAANRQAGFEGAVDADINVTGEAFLTQAGPTAAGRFVEVVRQAVLTETGAEPVLSTGGGTSDARFIKDYAPVVELGLVGTSMHQVDEHASVADLEGLTRIYQRLIDGYFSAFRAAG